MLLLCRSRAEVSASPVPGPELPSLVSCLTGRWVHGGALGKWEVNKLSPGVPGLAHPAPQFTPGETEGQRKRGIICPGL